MRPLTGEQMLHVWERCQGEAPVGRALGILEAACPEWTRERLAALPVGGRDSRLLRLRELTFGPVLAGVAKCPECGEQAEMDFRCGDVLAGIEAPAEPMRAEIGGVSVEFRVPNSLDLLAACRMPDLAAARNVVLSRCVVGEQPESAVAAVLDRMEQADPQAKVELTVTCPSCGRGWQALFDIAAYFWREIEVCARRIVREIHTLARAYGWNESEILALSAWRRQLYVEMVGG